ncbi:tripartite tricarboxylate transporter substrate binding protein [Rhodoplanes sp. TEM]|uniref:Tripartite tricarboxylate transporter substrate binding protein n=1 Tax=Rhodoplanes tepidamans TaxID=200616 RepID=A0ABT5JEE9_RHOTP|nr:MULTISPECIES: tripartite tricarboxylate transporter substrate binding protein [Rhodoplanes]MDC7787868.1 tripartite tricarboxylate transporter substrate binding protein [Rhodoplanes tepidamans]MDC7985673.1 tripartite tricarboxylate transporter substrate binding protein [Rhodoplanes sp. TEM]MDQ0357869.1 tripartite-type tricarboxylate transporter receptor subunit TctC [Rhodoplanes tepidamans]
MLRLNRRAVLAGAALAPFAAKAQTGPATIRIVVPYPPGGSVDAIARLVQPGLQQRLGTTVIIENRTGASGSIGTDHVAKATPDGSTWLFSFDNLVLNPFVLGKLPFDTETDLEPVYLLGKAPYVVCTKADKPYRSLADVIAAARERPGKITYGTPGAGSLGHLAMTLLGKEAGVQIVHVPYRGAAPALNDTLAGHVELFVGSIAVATPQIDAKAVRALAQLGETRAPTLPEVPTARESGFAKIAADAWWGFFAPAGTPGAAIERFRAAVDAGLQDAALAKQITEGQGVTLVRAGPEKLRAFVQAQMALWGPVAREHDITAK